MGANEEIRHDAGLGSAGAPVFAENLAGEKEGWLGYGTGLDAKSIQESVQSLYGIKTNGQLFIDRVIEIERTRQGDRLHLLFGPGTPNGIVRGQIDQDV